MTAVLVSVVGAFMPVIVNDICAVDVIPLMRIKLELMGAHDHEEQASEVGTLNVDGIVTYIYEGTINDEGVTVICRVVAYPYTRDENWPDIDENRDGILVNNDDVCEPCA